MTLLRVLLLYALYGYATAAAAVYFVVWYSSYEAPLYQISNIQYSKMKFKDYYIVRVVILAAAMKRSQNDFKTALVGVFDISHGIYVILCTPYFIAYGRLYTGCCCCRWPDDNATAGMQQRFTNTRVQVPVHACDVVRRKSTLE